MTPFRRTSPYESIVLRAIDIGEADRFCIFFARERGRLSARARGVRKLKSRMGAALLPLRSVSIELVEQDGRATIVAAVAGDDPAPPVEYARFVLLERGVELLLLLTEEDEPLPEVFDLLRQFLHLGHDSSLRLLQPFQLRLLHLLGLLPATSDDERFARLPQDVRSFVTLCTRTDDCRRLAELCPNDPALDAFLRSVIDSHLSRPLRSEGMEG